MRCQQRHAKYYICICKWEDNRPNYNVFVTFLESEKPKLKKCSNRWDNIIFLISIYLYFSCNTFVSTGFI